MPKPKLNEKDAELIYELLWKNAFTISNRLDKAKNEKFGNLGLKLESIIGKEAVEKIQATMLF